jgi:hypothetical protein
VKTYLGKFRWSTLLLLPIIAVISIIDFITGNDSEQNKPLNKRPIKNRRILPTLEAPTITVFVRPQEEELTVQSHN